MDYKRVLVFGAHPDDELGMSPAMALMASRGVHVAVCIATDGSEGYPRPEWKDTIVQMRAKEMEEADKVVGIAQRICLGIEDMGLTNDKETFKRFIKVIRDVRPDVVFTHGPHDIHRDHLATHALSKEATWQAGQPVSADLGEPWARSTTCTGCGKCVQACPVGALFEKGKATAEQVKRPEILAEVTERRPRG